MSIISVFLQLFGLGWLLLFIMMGIFGGKVIIGLKNPFTKNVEIITDVTIDHQKNKNPG